MNNRVKHLRKLKGLSQTDFGKLINLSQNHISSIEKGIRVLTARTIKDICNAYNVNVEWLTEGKEPIFIDPVDEYVIEDEEIREMTRLFLELDTDTRERVKQLIKKTLQK